MIRSAGNVGLLGAGVCGTTTHPARLNLTRLAVLRAGAIGERVNLQRQRAGRQIKPQRGPRAETNPERMHTVSDDPSRSEAVKRCA